MDEQPVSSVETDVLRTDTRSGLSIISVSCAFKAAGP